MKVEVKKIDALKREMKFEVPRERVAAAMDAVYTEIGKHAKVKGFRHGKVPRDILVKSHGQLAQDETMKKIIPEVYHEGLLQHQLDPVDLPQISHVTFKDGLLSFTATLDIRPEVKLEAYKGIEVIKKSSEVSEEEVQKTLDFFKKGREEKQVSLDDDFAKTMGFPSLEEFKTALKRQLASEKDRANRMEIENQIVENLLKNAKLIVPQSLVSRQLHYRLHETLQRFQKQGLKEDELKAKEVELKKELEPVAEKEVKIYLVFEEIAKRENIKASENENLASAVIKFLLKEAQWKDEVKNAKP